MLDTVLLWIEKNRSLWMHDLKQWLAIPSVSAKPEHEGDMQAAAEWAAFYLRGAGLEATLVKTARHPCVLATTPDGLCPPDAPHVLFYGHYDVQPAEPVELWVSPPFSPTVRDGKIFARGASDDKGQVFCHLAALNAWKQIAYELPVRLTVLLEGEEEIGSPNLRTVIKEYADRLASARTIIISDSSLFAPGVPAITTGLRGLVYYQLTVTGANTDLHSGIYGGAVANAANAMCQMLGQLHDSRGRVTVPGFYDQVQVPQEALRAAWKTLPFDESRFAAELALPELTGEAGYTTLERRWCRPTLDINGLTSGYQGAGAKTVLPATASAKVSMRLVPDQDAVMIAEAFEKHIAVITPPGVRVTLERLSASPAALTPTDSPAIAAAAQACEVGMGQKPVLVREGGSIPVVTWFKELLNVDAVLLGFGLPDDNLHAPNEKLDVECFYAGIRTAAALYDQLAQRLH
jgi:acetylornithine deacetylase/succinyl-diaminopimelate desuccinylase-like protein